MKREVGGRRSEVGGTAAPSWRAVALLILLGAGGAAHAQTLAITGGRVFPVSGPAIDNGTVLVRDGKVVAVGANVSIPADAQRVNAAGKWVTPGIFNAATSLGIMEVGAVQETVDIPARGRGDAITASHRVWEGFNSASPLLQVTRNDGVTTVGVVPGGGLISGQAAIFDLSDGSMTDLLLGAPVAMLADIGSKGQDRGASRGEIIARLREVLGDTREYMRRRADYNRNQSRELAARRADLEAMIPVVEGRLPLMIDADRASDLEAALALGREFNLRLILTSAAEGWKVADKIAAAKVPVMIGASNNIPQSFATLGARQENAALLGRAGATIVINGGADAFNARNVKYEAGLAVSYGLPWDDALRAVTLTPAEVFGVADRVGSLQPGRDATLVIWDGDPFELSTRAEKVYVRGKEVQRLSRQDELMRRYRALPPDFRRQP